MVGRQCLLSLFFEPVMEAIHGAPCLSGGVGDGQVRITNERKGVLSNFGTVTDMGHRKRKDKNNPTIG